MIGPSGKTLLIHATNVTGLGAAQVVDSLLGPLCDRLEQTTFVYVPENGLLSTFRTDNEKVSIRRCPRYLPNALSRAVECIVPWFSFPQSDQTLVLGDIPLRGRRNQVLFVQQPHLAAPEVNPFSGTSLTFRISRRLFERHLGAVSRIIVQSEPMKEALENSYPGVDGRVRVIAHPPPRALQAPPDGAASGTSNKPLLLLYPAAGYPHKNHAILRAMDAPGLREPTVLGQMLITLTSTEAISLASIPWVRNVGRLSPETCMSFYEKADALFFPSLLESYGLPLVEAMTLRLPIVCADLPYARWLCGGEAIYFDPTSGRDAARAVTELAIRLRSGWRPDWRSALGKLPASWEVVAAQFAELLA